MHALGGDGVSRGRTVSVWAACAELWGVQGQWGYGGYGPA